MKIHPPPAKHPLPPQAKKVFSGQIFDVYQWEQEMFDGSVAVFEKVKRTDTVNIIAVTPDQKLLLGHEEQPGTPPFYGTFGGRIDPGEDPLNAAKRELLEETGYEAPDWQLLHAFQPLKKIEWAIYTFVARDCRRTQDQKLESGEKIDLLTVSWSEFLELAQRPDFRDQEITFMVLQALVHPEKMTTLKRLLFGKK